jgi:hypothetical protein
MFERAMRIDPNFAEAYAWLGLVIYEEFGNGEGTRTTLEAAIANANKALIIDPELIVARRALMYLS